MVVAARKQRAAGGIVVRETVEGKSLLGQQAEKLAAEHLVVAGHVAAEGGVLVGNGADQGDVDVHAGVDVDEAGVDGVVAVGVAAAAVEEVAADVEQVVALAGGGPAVAGGAVHDKRVVVVAREPPHGGCGQLHVVVKVPGEHVAVEGVAQERAVGKPGGEPLVVGEAQPGPHQAAERGQPLVLVVDLLDVEEAPVVVRAADAAVGQPGLVEVLRVVGAGVRCQLRRNAVVEHSIERPGLAEAGQRRLDLRQVLRVRKVGRSERQLRRRASVPVDPRHVHGNGSVEPVALRRREPGDNLRHELAHGLEAPGIPGRGSRLLMYHGDNEVCVADPIHENQPLWWRLVVVQKGRAVHNAGLDGEPQVVQGSRGPEVGVVRVGQGGDLRRSQIRAVGQEVPLEVVVAWEPDLGLELGAAGDRQTVVRQQEVHVRQQPLIEVDPVLPREAVSQRFAQRAAGLVDVRPQVRQVAGGGDAAVLVVPSEEVLLVETLVFRQVLQQIEHLGVRHKIVPVFDKIRPLGPRLVVCERRVHLQQRDNQCRRDDQDAQHLLVEVAVQAELQQQQKLIAGPLLQSVEA